MLPPAKPHKQTHPTCPLPPPPPQKKGNLAILYQPSKGSIQHSCLEIPHPASHHSWKAPNQHTLPKTYPKSLTTTKAKYTYIISTSKHNLQYTYLALPRNPTQRPIQNPQTSSPTHPLLPQPPTQEKAKPAILYQPSKGNIQHSWLELPHPASHHSWKMPKPTHTT